MAMNQASFLDYLRGQGQAFNPYAAGQKRYGSKPSPNMGPNSAPGYKDREVRAREHRNAILRRLKAQQSGQYMNPDYLRMMK